MYPENPEGTQVIVGSMNMGYISDTARNRTHNLFRPKREPIPLCHSDGQFFGLLSSRMSSFLYSHDVVTACHRLFVTKLTSLKSICRFSKKMIAYIFISVDISGAELNNIVVNSQICMISSRHHVTS